jgi:hypothetical protein
LDKQPAAGLRRQGDYITRDLATGLVSRFAASFDAAVMNVNPQPVHGILRTINKQSQRIIVRKAGLRHPLTEAAKVTQHRANFFAERVALFRR